VVEISLVQPDQSGRLKDRWAGSPVDPPDICREGISPGYLEPQEQLMNYGYSEQRM